MKYSKNLDDSSNDLRFFDLKLASRNTFGIVVSYGFSMVTSSGVH